MRITTSIADCLFGAPQDLGGAYSLDSDVFDNQDFANFEADIERLSHLRSALEIDGNNLNLLWRILEIQFKVYGSQFIGNAPILLTIGELYEAESEMQIAEEIYLEALGIIQSNGNQLHSELMGRVLLDLYSVYEKMENARELSKIEGRLKVYWSTRYADMQKSCKVHYLPSSAFLAVS